MVVVAEAEPTVAHLRLQLDPVARLGVPCACDRPISVHAGVGDPGRRHGPAGRSVSNSARVQHNFVRSAWFGDEVLWLASDAAQVFRSLTQLVWTAFPAYPPYEGQFAEIVPHLTIADHGAPGEMQAAERTVQPHLPISAITRAVTLMAEQPSGRWEAAESFALNG